MKGRTVDGVKAAKMIADLTAWTCDNHGVLPPKMAQQDGQMKACSHELTSQVPKASTTVKFGMLGAARIGPDALLTPAKSHPEWRFCSSIQDPVKVAAYAKKHQIPRTYSGENCYDRVLEDADVDVFHPAVQRLKEIINSGELGKVKNIKAEFAVRVSYPPFFLKDDVRFDYSLGGGVMMDMEQVIQNNTHAVTTNNLRDYSVSSICPPLPHQQQSDQNQGCSRSRTSEGSNTIDKSMHALLAFPSSVTGSYTLILPCPAGAVWDTTKSLKRATARIQQVTIRPKHGAQHVERVYRFKSGFGSNGVNVSLSLEAFVNKHGNAMRNEDFSFVTVVKCCMLHPPVGFTGILDSTFGFPNEHTAALCWIGITKGAKVIIRDTWKGHVI
ncbi:hypothetical protein BJ912DRAFT_929839 [Pholiota molesta]|nr:hypothetical protein BJ912DRAFT_929839 [Pholiota molesta]